MADKSARKSVMKPLLRAGLLVLLVLAAPSLAHAWTCPPGQIDFGINAHCNSFVANVGMTAPLGPWYTYWPYNAHFQLPAPVGGWPYWPVSVAAVPNQGFVPSHQPPQVQPTYFQPSGLQPAGYSGQAPSYWYGR
jgi:hypothetical protein